VVGFVLDSAAVLTAIHERNPQPRPALYGVDGNNDPGLLRNAPPELLRGMRFTAPTSPKGNENYERFAASYRRTLGEEPFRVEFTYDAIYLIALAMVAAGENTPAAVAAGLGPVSRPDGATPLLIGKGPEGFALALASPGADLDYAGASGAIDFDAAGDVQSATFVVRQVIDGPDGLIFEDGARLTVP
jgi:ABC-type branched-subunit amino acid transport system substrate-binding protein